MNFSFSLGEVARLTGAEACPGAEAVRIGGIAALKSAKPGDLSFLTHARYASDLAATRATAVILPVRCDLPVPDGVHLLRAQDPQAAITNLCRELEKALWPAVPPGVHPTAVVDPTAELGDGVHIGPGCVVEAGARLGAGCRLDAGAVVGRASSVGAGTWLGPRVVVYPECTVGARVRLHAGAVIGADGFGYEFEAGRHRKVPQVGTVVVEDDVEIGANACIDRGRFGPTRIGQGSKIDNLAQIGHNCTVGRHCIIVAQVGIAGSTTLGDYVMIGGQAGLAGHIEIGAASKIAAQTGVAQSLPPKSQVMGSPAIESFPERRFQAVRHRLPEALRKLEQLEERLAKIEGKPE